jgi:tRNA (mo5U34)-methyltransferase
MATGTTDQRTELAREVQALTWYHTIELGGGVVTPGEYDTRAALRRIPFPADLAGRRCLDVGTHDGFWAFEMERRGAADVVGIDLDDPRRVDFSEPAPDLSAEVLADREARPLAFALARRALDSRVQRRDLSVYDLDPAEVGHFDFAFVGTLLLHLREPVRALTAIRNVLTPGTGELLVNDPIALKMTLLHPRTPLHTLSLLPGKPFWWLPNARGLRRYVEKAGFGDVDGGGPYLVPRGPGYARDPLPRTLTNVAWRAVHERGMPHAWARGHAP